MPMISELFSVPLDQMGLDSEDLGPLRDWETLYGNRDGRIDFFERENLVILFPLSFRKVAFNLFLNQSLLNRVGATDARVSGPFLHLTLSNGQMKEIHYDSQGRVDEIRWLTPDGSFRSLSYDYGESFEEPLPVQVLLTDSREGVLADEIFTDPQNLPSLPEEFSLVTLGFFEEAVNSRRSLWINRLAKEHDFEKLEQACSQSHSQLVGAFFTSLLLPRKGESTAEEMAVISLALRLWRSLTRNPTPGRLLRAVAILRSIPNLAYRGLLVCEDFLERNNTFNRMLAHFNPVERQNITHLLSQFTPEDAQSPPKIPAFSLSDEARKTFPCLEAQENPNLWEPYRQKVKATIKAMHKEKERLKNEARATRSAGQSITAECLMTGDEVLTDNLDEFERESGSKKGIETQNLLPFFQEALKTLGDLSNPTGTVLWQGQDTQPLNPPQRIRAIWSSLALQPDGNLKGEWAASFHQGSGEPADLSQLEDPFFLRFKNEHRDLVNQGYLVNVSMQANSWILIAFKPTSLIKEQFFFFPLSEGIVISFDRKRQLYKKVEMGDLGLINLSLEKEGRITTATFTFNFIKREGQCYVTATDKKYELGSVTLVESDGRSVTYQSNFDDFLSLEE